MGRVEGKIALVTGAASGLGLATSRALAAQGATVIMTDVDDKAGELAAEAIEGASYQHLDVSGEQNWIGLMGEIELRYQHLDILVNNAGIVQLASVEQTTEELWRKIHSVGTDGTFFGCKHGLELMKKGNSGSIINLCSTASIQGGPNIFAYAASKSAIRGMTKSVACLSAQEGYGIRCNSVHPGNMDTPMLRDIAEVVRQNNPEAAAGMDQVWVGEPEDVANMILFLASDESRSVNGAAMVVDNTSTITEGVVPKH